MIKVLVVDDHPIFRTGAVASIVAQGDFEVVAEAETASDALVAIDQHQPEVVLMDIRLKGKVNGVELARQIKEQNERVRIVVLTNYSNEPYIKAMMEIGVEGYMLKDSPPHDVIQALRMVVDGRTVFSSKVTDIIVRGYLSPGRDARIPSPDNVTKREIEVLELVADGASNMQIAASLHVSESTVQYHLTNIYSKLRVHSRAEAVIHAAREGLIVIDE